MENAMVTALPVDLMPRDLNVMASRYELTAAEAEVTRLLAQGNSLATIAQTTGRTMATVRSHLKSVFMKTGTHRQVELVVLVNACVNSL